MEMLVVSQWLTGVDGVHGDKSVANGALLLFVAGRADQRPGDQQHCLHQYVCLGDAPQTPGFWHLGLHQEPVQHFRWHHCCDQVSRLLTSRLQNLTDHV